MFSYPIKDAKRRVITPLRSPNIVIFLCLVLMTLGSNSKIKIYKSIPKVRESKIPTKVSLTTVIFKDGANSEPVNNLGVLAYDNEKECFVAIELEASSVSESQALEIAKSIRF